MSEEQEPTNITESVKPVAPISTKVPMYLWEFANAHELLAKAASELRRYLAEIAQDGSITIHTIEARAKSLGSFTNKANRTDANGASKYSNPGREICDCIAARVILFTNTDRALLAELIDSRFSVQERLNPGETKHNGYDSLHIIVTGIEHDDPASRHPNLQAFFKTFPGAELQLRTVAAHAWAEYEHDIRYKPGAYQDLSEHEQGRINQWFIEAGGLRRYMDQIFDDIQKALHAAPTIGAAAAAAPDYDQNVIDDECGSNPTSIALSTETLMEFVKQRFPLTDPGDPAQAAALTEQLKMLGVTTLEALAKVLGEINDDHLAALMDYPPETPALRRLDDQLLAALEDRYVTAASGKERADLLNLRLRRVRGKFAIYQISDTDGDEGLYTAARAVRELARKVADRYGLDAASTSSLVTSVIDDFSGAARPVPVKTTRGTIYVASNLSRYAAEQALIELTDGVAMLDPESELTVRRAGDILVSARGRDASTSDIGSQK